MALPIFFSIVEEVIDPTTNLPIVKLLISNKSAFGASSQNYILPNNAGGTTTVGQYGGAKNSAVYNTTSSIVPKMALLFNPHGRVVTPNFGQAIIDINQPYNFVGISLTASSSVRAFWDKIVYSLPAPEERANFAMAFNGQNAVLFGGSDLLQFYNDTWEWDGFKWNQTTGFVGSVPQARRYHAMVYDSNDDAIYMYGGINSSDTYLADTRPYQGGTWLEFAGIANPGSRAHHKMSFDSVRAKTVMFGGKNSGGTLSDTWEMQGQVWTQVFPTTSPPARYDHSMAFDKSRNRTVLFGGTDGTTEFNDVWEYDGITWKEINVNTAPALRSQAELVYDDDRKVCILFGGYSDFQNNFLNDTWLYDATGWTQYVISGPNPRSYFGMTYDNLRNKVVVFGGLNTLFPDSIAALSDLWEFGVPPNPVSVQTTGDGYVYFDMANNLPVLGDFLGPSAVFGTVAPVYDGYSPIFGIAVDNPVIDPNDAPNPLSIDLNGNPVGIIKMRIRPFYGFISPTLPSISTFSPSAGHVGDIITVDGYVFVGTSQVKINDGYDSTATFNTVSNNQLTFVVPAGAQKGTITITNAQGDSTSLTDFVTLPTISSINVVDHAVGSAIVIHGHTFTYTSSITFNGTNQPTFTVDNDTQITTTIPVGATTGDIVVNITYPSSGTYAATYPNFSVVAPPIISSIAPITGPVGAAAYTTLNGGINASVTIITVTSTSGFNSTGVIVIELEQISYTGTTPTTFTGCVRGYNSTTAASHLTAAAVSSLSINPYGYVSLMGSGFAVSGSSLDGYGTIDFIDVLTMTQILSASRTVFNDGLISIIVPNPGISQPSTNYYIRITTDGGTATSSQQFTIIPSPKFLTAATTTLNGGISSIDTVITVTSTTGFVSNNFFIENEQVSYTGTTPTTFTGCVRGINGTSAVSHTSGKTVKAVTFISQTNDAQGVAGSLVRIFGDYGFTGISKVTFNGYTSPAVSFINDGYVTAKVPLVSSATDITGYLSLISTGGTKSTVDAPTTNPINFTILQAPTITSFANVSGGQTGKTNDIIVINGTNLLAVSNVIFTTDAYATFSVINSTTIHAIVPTGPPTTTIVPAPSQGPITITKGETSPYDFVAVSSQNFLYYPAPAFSVSSPAAVDGVNGGYGTIVTLDGTNLNWGGTPTVTFGGVTASLNSVFINNIVAVVPSGAGNSVTVTTAGGSATVGFVTLQPVSISSFRTDYAPPRSRINLHTAAPQQNTKVDVYGSNFRTSPDMVVRVSSDRTGSTYTMPFTYVDSGHLYFYTSTLVPIAGDTCHIQVATYYPGGQYSAAVGDLELIVIVT